MNYFFTFFVLLFLHANSVIAQDQLLEQSDLFINSIIKEDYAYIVDHTISTVVENGGGKDLYIKMVKSYRDQQKTSSTFVVQSKDLKIDFLEKNDSTTQAIISFSAILQLGEERFTGKQYLLAHKLESDTQWKFIALDTYDEDSIALFVTDYNTKLTWPTIEPLLMIEKEK